MFYKKKLSPIVRVFGVLVAVAMLSATLAAGGMLSHYSQAVLDQGPIAYWQFEDASSADGATALDTAGTGETYHGTYNGSVSLVAGPGLPGLPGNAASFDQSIDYVTAADTSSASSNPFPFGASDRTAIAWVRRTATATQAFFDYGTYGSVGQEFTLFATSALGGSQYGDSVFNTQGTAGGEWHFVALTVSGGTTSPTWTIYVDNVAPVSKALSTNTVLTGTAWIGRISNGLGWDGEVDEMAMFDRALESGEIAAIYNAAFVAIPEPATVVLAVMGVVVLLLAGQRHRTVIAQIVPAKPRDATT